MTRGVPVQATSVQARVARASILITIGLVAAVACVVAASEHPSADVKPHVVFVTGDDEYRSEITLPMIAAILEAHHGLRTSIARAVPRPQTKDNIEGLEALDSADLMVMYTRFRALPDDQLRRILAFTGSGKPLIGFRTTTHAFLYPADSPHRDLNDAFGRDVFGQKWITHHGHRSSTRVTLRDSNRGHPILSGVTPFHARSWLYHVAPLDGDDNTVLLEGTSEGSDKVSRRTEFPLTQPVAWARTHNGARVFFTTLGHPADFTHESMRRLVVNAVLWALGRDVPPGGADVTVVGTYTAPETFDLSKVQE